MLELSRHSQNQLNRKDYSDRYLESTQKTMRTQYAKRSPVDGSPVEDVNDIIHRVALSVALAEIKYAWTPEQILNATLADAINHPKVIEWANAFADDIGMQRWWANTPANINADPEISFKVLQYWAYGRMEIGLGHPDHPAFKTTDEQEHCIWNQAEELRRKYENKDPALIKSKNKSWKWEMGRLASELRGKGCLAACGVAYVTDSLEGIQEAARMEAMAAKASMGMGLNTSKLRPWASITSGGAAASGPDRFYEKSIAQAVDAVAQGGRRGGALIELRNSDHPDILFFIDKKRLLPQPDPALAKLDPEAYGKQYHEYLKRQGYLKNTNVTVLAMPSFVEKAQSDEWYQCTFEGQPWYGPVWDPRRPTGKVNEQTKELEYEEYSVDLAKYPRAADTTGVEISPDGRARIRGHLYAPEVIDRIAENMANGGEPGIMFYTLVNAANANSHVYDLDTCNPCGEQCLPAGPGKDGRVYMGTCNLSSLHVAHPDYWDDQGRYVYERMQAVAERQQRFMDNVTDVSWYPEPAQNWTARAERRNGGGFAGVAEFLSRLGYRFGSESACYQVANLFASYAEASVRASKDLAIERGPYPLHKGSLFAEPMRNACLLNNAPTGTLAQMMQTSWGVEAHSGIAFHRTVRTQKVKFGAPGFVDVLRQNGVATEDAQAIVEQIYETAQNNTHTVASCQGVPGVPKAVQDAYPIAIEIEPDDYINHLAACYRGASRLLPPAMNAISNTCSVRPGTDPAKIKAAVFQAYKLGVKDITFYPDGSRLSQPIQKIAKPLHDQPAAREVVAAFNVGEESRTVDIAHTDGSTFKVAVGAPEGIKTLHISLNHMVGRAGQLIEIYARMGKNGDAGPFEAIGRLASAFLQYAAKYGEEERAKAEDLVIKQLSHIQSGHPVFHKFPGEEKAGVVESACDGIAHAIRRYRSIYSGKPREPEAQPAGKRCTKCEGQLVKTDGCWNCMGCGDSRCG